MLKQRQVSKEIPNRIKKGYNPESIEREIVADFVGEVMLGGKYYRIEFSVGHNGTVATVYNVGKIKKDVPPSTKLIAVVGSQALDGTSSNNIILNEDHTVKNNISDNSEDYSDISDIKVEFF